MGLKVLIIHLTYVLLFGSRFLGVAERLHLAEIDVHNCSNGLQ
jgi:hypothetical protein